MRVQEILQESNERNCLAQKYVQLCMLGTLNQWAINASKNNQENSNDQSILKLLVLALHSLPRKHR